jgi:hypothetical protein
VVAKDNVYLVSCRDVAEDQLGRAITASTREEEQFGQDYGVIAKEIKGLDPGRVIAVSFAQPYCPGQIWVRASRATWRTWSSVSAIAHDASRFHR